MPHRRNKKLLVWDLHSTQPENFRYSRVEREQCGYTILVCRFSFLIRNCGMEPKLIQKKDLEKKKQKNKLWSRTKRTAWVKWKKDISLGWLTVPRASAEEWQNPDTLLGSVNWFKKKVGRSNSPRMLLVHCLRPCLHPPSSNWVIK